MKISDLSRLFLTLLLSMTWIASDARAEDAVEADLKLLQGKWELVSAEKNGADCTKVDFQRSPEIEFQKDIWLQKVDGRPVYFAPNSRIVLVPSTTPKAFDHNMSIDDSYGKAHKFQYPGIYALKGDSLHMCWGVDVKKRPTKFATHANDGRYLVEYKRIRPKNEEQSK